jgi:gliding motility-associated-like protein
MRLVLLLLLAITVLPLSRELFGQVVVTVQPPTVEVVEIDPLTGLVRIEWTESPSPDIEGYIVARWLVDRVITIDSAKSPDARSLVFQDFSTASGPGRYVVYAWDQNGNNSYYKEPAHHTVYNRLEWDSCRAEITLEWTGYVGWENRLTGYNLYMLEGSESTLLQTGITGNTITLGGIQENSEFCYYLEANRDDGVSSRSNRVCKSTGMPRPPSYINANQGSIENEKVRLDFLIDSLVFTDRYVLTRKSAQGIIDSILWVQDHTSSTLSHEDNPSPLENLYSYQLIALNSCNQPVSFSNQAGYMYLEGTATPEEIRLEWNAYEHWLGGVEEYRVYRVNEQGEVLLAGTTGAGSTSFVEPTSNLTGDQRAGRVCYLIEARETGLNPHGITGVSKSNVACILLDTEVFIPNAFTPNGDLINDLFLPSFNFLPLEYKILIYNRWGNLVFESSNPLQAWDGRSRNGESLPEGVYVYHLQYTSYTGQEKQLKGHITVIYP